MDYTDVCLALTGRFREIMHLARHLFYTRRTCTCI